MTCIVGLVDDGRVYFGADKLRSIGWSSSFVSDEEKIWKYKDYLIGVAGLCRTHHVVEYVLETVGGKDTFELTTAREVTEHFSEPIRKKLLDYGVTKKENNHEEVEGTILLGAHGKIYLIDSAFSVHTFSTHIAIGSGGEYALGSLFALERSGYVRPEIRIKTAIEAAIEYDRSCGGSITILHT